MKVKEIIVMLEKLQSIAMDSMLELHEKFEQEEATDDDVNEWTNLAHIRTSLEKAKRIPVA